MRGLFRKIGFVWRFLWVKFTVPQVALHGFVFFEKDVTFKVEPSARIVIKNRAYLKKGCVLECSGTGLMELGERVSIGHYAWLGCRNSLILHHDTIIGQSSTIFDATHQYDENGVFIDQVYDLGRCEIGPATYIFVQCVVGPNVTIAANCRVMPNSVVHHDITEPGTDWGGRTIRRRV